MALPTQREGLLFAMLTEETRSKDPQSRHCARLLFRELLFKIMQARVPENSLFKLTGISPFNHKVNHKNWLDLLTPCCHKKDY